MPKKYKTRRTRQSNETTPTKDGKFKVNSVESVPKRFWGMVITYAEFEWEWKEGDTDESK